MQIKIKAYYRNFDREIYKHLDDSDRSFVIDDLYFFEEEGVHDFDGEGHHEKYIFVMWTGLTDSNGVEIYEGDIVRESHCISGSEFDIHNGVIVYDGGSFILDFRKLNNGRIGAYDVRKRKPSADYHREWHVVGNIYENQEVINE